MNIVFLGLCFSREELSYHMKHSKCGIQSATNNFQWAFFNSLDNGSWEKENHFYLLYILPIGTYPLKHSDLFIKSSFWETPFLKAQSASFINFPILKSYCVYYNIKKKLRNLLSTLTEDTVVVTYNLYRPFLRAAYDLKKEGYSFKIVNIVLDLTLNYGKVSQNYWRRMYEYFEERNSLELSGSDGFILLTELMKNPLTIDTRPYLVVEGLVDVNAIDNTIKYLDKHNYILYSGTLDSKYGIVNLMDAFIIYKTSNPDSRLELWLCGYGDAQTRVLEYVGKYPFIKYKGFVSREEALQLQKNSLFLINPRPNVGEYVKYSFPSKTLEYMALGKVVVMHRLPGIPVDYNDYLIYFDTQTIEGMAHTIKAVIEMGKEQLTVLGEKNREFIFREKNSLIQSSKMIQFLKEKIL